MMEVKLAELKEASRNFGAADITRAYLNDAVLSFEAKARIRAIQEIYFKGKGLDR